MRHGHEALRDRALHGVSVLRAPHHSLMIAFTAEWESGEIVVDGAELSDAKWFSCDALPMIPPPVSIARQLIDAWVTEMAERTPRR